MLYPEIALTALRNNHWYYKIYCMGINAIFACALPLGLLLYLNVYTVLGNAYIYQDTLIVFKFSITKVYYYLLLNTQIIMYFNSFTGSWA